MSYSSQPQQPEPSTKKALFRQWHTWGSDSQSLKQFARERANGRDEQTKRQAKTWLRNKTTSFKNPPLGIGSSRSKKNHQAPPSKAPAPKAKPGRAREHTE